MAFVGAKWWKFDLHTHTPASFDYANGDTTNLKQTISPKEWLQSYVDNGIHCVAVTDHNTGEWIDKLKVEAEIFRSEGKEIYIFPGVEITANSNIHILGIFDPSKTTADINAVVGASKFRGTKGDSDSVAEESAENIIEEIIKSGGVAIPAHIDMKAGLCQTTAMTIKQVCKKAHAVEIIFPFNPNRNPEAPLSRYNNLRIKLPSIIGSDSHHPSKVGRAFTWIKMSAPCIEGLKLALIDDTSSLIRSDDIEEGGNPNVSSNLILKSLTVKESKYAGRSTPLNIEFNPWLNCIIGSRGSGKSSILEFIRIAMDRSSEVLQLRDTNEIKKSFESFLKIPISKDAEGVMTQNSQIECIYEKDGATYNLIWNKSDNLVKIKKFTDNNWVDEVGSVYSRFPIKIFSQKQVFDLAKDPTSLLKFIDESASVDIQKWKMEWEVVISHLKTLYSQQREKKAKISNKNILLGQLLDVNHKINLIENSNHSDLFDKYQKLMRKKSGLDILYSEIQSFIDNSKEVMNNQISFEILKSLDSIEDKEILDATNYIQVKFGVFCNEVNQKIIDFEKDLNGFNQWYPHSQLVNEYHSVTKEYNEVIQAFNDQGINSLEQ
ncbi:AAA family ATPase, partial [Priestia endophytica]